MRKIYGACRSLKYFPLVYSGFRSSLHQTETAMGRTYKLLIIIIIIIIIIRSVERGICAIATSTMNELFL